MERLLPAPFAYVLLYVTLYGAFGVASPYWPKLFESKGLTPQQIGLILAAALVMRLAAGPVVGRLADLLGSLRLVLASCIVAAAAAAAAYTWADSLLARSSDRSRSGSRPRADHVPRRRADSQRGKTRTAGKPFEYGRIRGAASAAFLVGTLVIGQLIVPADLSPIIWMNAALLIVAAAATALLPGDCP